MRKAGNIVLGFLLILSLAFRVDAAEYAQFADLQEDWYTPYVSEAIELELMSGTSADRWNPDLELNRGMAATILYRMSSSPNWSMVSVFEDVDPHAYYAKAVSFGCELGIINGYEDGRFGADDLITRQDLVKLLYGWARIYAPETTDQSAELDSFLDKEDVSEYALSAMEWAYGNQILAGSDGRILPLEYCTRAQAAKFFTQTKHLKKTGQEEQDPEMNEQDQNSEDQPSSTVELPVESVVDVVEDPQPAPEQSDPFEQDQELPSDENSQETEQPQQEENSESEKPEGSELVETPLNPEQEELLKLDPVAPGEADSLELLRNVQMYGIDISYHNGNIDLSNYQGQFVIIRGGYWTEVDEKFYDYVAECEKYGIPYGVYWYSYAMDEKEAIEEANVCLQTIRSTNPTMGVWIDMEDADQWKRNHGWEVSASTIGPICQNFCKILESRGYYTGIYASLNWQKYLAGCDDYPRWIAHWGENNGKIHYDYSGSAVLYQYTSRPVDKNILYLEPSELQNAFLRLARLTFQYK